MPSPRKVNRVALYARLSVATEESVSIERQIDAGRRYAELRGWTVVAEARDEGVSASRNKPEERLGWRTLINHEERFEAVIIWKVDRLARRVLDFLHASEALENRGAALVAVEDPIDMTTGAGRAFATMLAVFGELEASAMSARARDARRKLIATGRRAGGRPPYGWMNIDNPDGAGKVLAQDPERITVVSDMVRMALEGRSVHSIRRWLEAEGIKPRSRAGVVGAWHDATVEDILRNPVLAGMVPYTPGRKPGERLDPFAVVRDHEGVAIVDVSVAIISSEERRQLLAVLDEAKRPGTRERAGSEPALLHGLARCASCSGPLYRGTANGGYRQLRCQNRSCDRQFTVTRAGVEAAVEETFLRERGDALVVKLTEVRTSSPSRLGDIEEAINKVLAELGSDAPTRPDSLMRLDDLKKMREAARSESDGPAERTWTYEGRTNREAWDADDSVEERNALLRTALRSVKVRPGSGRGKRFDPERVEYEWADLPDADSIRVVPLLVAETSSRRRRR